MLGIGQRNTSIQGLTNLIPLCDEAWIYHNETTTSTFHPKVYYFEKAGDKAIVFIGSSNLTGGGLFSNYEAGFYSEYDLKVDSEAIKFEKIKKMFQTYSTPSDFCKPLTAQLLEELAEFYLSDETREIIIEDLEEGTQGIVGIEVKVRKRVFGSKRFSRPALPKSESTRQVIKPIPVTPSVIESPLV